MLVEKEENVNFVVFGLLELMLQLEKKGTTYSSFIRDLKNSKVAVNRKMLAQIAVLDTQCFDKVVNFVRNH